MCLCGFFRRAVPFVERLQDWKESVTKIQEQSQIILSHVASFLTQGVKSKQYEYVLLNILANKVTIIKKMKIIEILCYGE